MAVVGMDFGAHSCYIAVARAGGIETIANEYSDRCTPTYVSLNEKQRAMGAAAKQQFATNPRNTLNGFKIMIGRKFKDPVVQAEIQKLSYIVKEGPNGETGICVRFMDEDQTFTPVQITSMMLTKLKHIAEAVLKIKVVDIVVSAPCSFTDHQRHGIIDACHIAGLNCLRVMNDTLAVSLSYGIYKQDLPGEKEKSRNVVFVDMGHTSLQVSLCAFNKGKLKMLAVATDPFLGGRDFDRKLLEHFAAEFMVKYKLDILSNAKATIRLNAEVEKVKKLMSANTQNIPLNIECLMNDVDVHTSVNRATFEEIIAPFLVKAEKTMRSLLDDIKFSLSDVCAVEIVGGSTRVAVIKDIVKQVFGMEPSTTLNADEAVARGCALQCAILSPTFRVRDFSISDCQLYPITLRWQGGLDEDSDLEICPKFHAVPFFKLLTFFRKEPLTIDCRYTYPNDIPYSEPKIGSFCVNNIVPQPSGESSKIKVKVAMNNHGIFNVASASIVEKLVEMEEVKDEAIGEETGKMNGSEGGNVEMGPSDVDQTMSSEDQSNKDDPPSNETQPDQNMQTDDAVPNDKDSQEKKSVDKKEDKKSPKKKSVKIVDLPVVAMVQKLSIQELNRCTENEAQMIMQDKHEKERLYAKNAVEEYVYDMRDKLSSTYESYITAKDNASFTQLLNDSETWIYEEGEDVCKSEYVKKLEELRAMGDPVMRRFEESCNRPIAFEAFGAALQRVRKVIELIINKDEKYDHLTSDDVQKLEKCVREKNDWFEKQLNQVNKLALHDNPTVLTTQILSEQQSLESTSNPIINKPKPKVEPPKEEKPEENHEEGKGAPVQEEGATPNSMDQQGQGEGTPSEETMELD